MVFVFSLFDGRRMRRSRDGTFGKAGETMGSDGNEREDG